MSSSKPTQMNKPQRARFAKETINKLIPHLLKHNPATQAAVSKSELIHYIPRSKSAPKTSTSTDAAASMPQEIKSKSPKISVIKSDTYLAAQSLLQKYTPETRIGVLNMCSVYQPGGGVLLGSKAQEESLCLRSTLFASLASDITFYPLSPNQAIYSPDILVFRSEALETMKKEDWFAVDVISVAAVRGPEVTKEGKYVEDKDREAMRLKIKLIFQVARTKGCKVLVLGALGCGAYGNPVEEVAELFRRCMLGKGYEMEGIDEVVFAIFDEGRNLRVFREVFEKEKKEVVGGEIEGVGKKSD